ncbi:MAG: lipoyl(octanoyl) transferase LipB [Planctomycetaceae bacterium]
MSSGHTQHWPTRAAAALEVRLLGRVDWDSATGLQEYYAYEMSGRTDAGGVLILCEHPPLISVGRQGSRRQILASDEELSASGISLRWTARSGGAVVHAPGQLVIYLLLPLDRLGMGVGEYRRRMEQALLSVCHEQRVPAKRLEGSPGLWTRGGQVGFLGAVVKSWITQFGGWLNVAPAPGFLKLAGSELSSVALSAYETAIPQTETGLSRVSEQRVTSLQEQLQRRVSMHSTRESAIRHVSAAFGYDTIHTHTGHPQLVRTQRTVVTQLGVCDYTGRGQG